MTAANEFLDIGEVARRSGLPPSTLHVWEKHGLVTPIGRAGLRRQYPPDILKRIATIVTFQRGGFTLAEISRLLAPDAFAGGKTDLVAKLDELRLRRQELEAAITGLEHAIACTEPSPIECAEFESMLGGVLPVKRAQP